MAPEPLAAAVDDCLRRLDRITSGLHRASDASTLPYNAAESCILLQSLATLNSLLHAGESLIDLEVKRWGL